VGVLVCRVFFFMVGVVFSLGKRGGGLPFVLGGVFVGFPLVCVVFLFVGVGFFWGGMGPRGWVGFGWGVFGDEWGRGVGVLSCGSGKGKVGKSRKKNPGSKISRSFS